MRKLFSLIAAVLFAGSMMAAEATLQYTGSTTTNMAGDGANNAEIVGLDANVFTVICEKGANQNNIGLNKAGDIRLYADKDGGNGNKLIVNIVSGEILSIVLDIKQQATFVVKAGEDVVEAVEGAYAINAASFSIQNTTTNATTQLQLNKITINYEAGEAPKVATPVIEGKEYFIGSTTVTMSCSTENSDIYYTVDGTTDPKCDCSAAPEYENPITLTETTTIMAAAYTGNDWSAVATKTFTKVEAATCAQAAALAADEITGLNEVVVTYVNGLNIYVKDETGGALIYGSLNLKPGDVVKGFIGKSSPYNGLPELKPLVTLEDLEVVAGEAPEPEELTAVPTVDDINKLVLLKGVQFKDTTFASNKNITAVLGEEEFIVRNNFGIKDVKFDTEKKYDIVGAGAIYVKNDETTLQLYFISAEEAETPIVENDTIYPEFDYAEVTYLADYKAWQINLYAENEDYVPDFYIGVYAKSEEMKIAGTYTNEEEEIAFVEIYTSLNDSAVAVESSDFVVTFLEEDVYHYEFTFVGDDDKVYIIDAELRTMAFDEDGEEIELVDGEEEGVEETEAAVKAIKVIKNGQIIIEKNGVKYNALGTRL
jgi:hypothetical protein